jgi:hypothetical protein
VWIEPYEVKMALHDDVSGLPVVTSLADRPGSRDESQQQDRIHEAAVIGYEHGWATGECLIQTRNLFDPVNAEKWQPGSGEETEVLMGQPLNHFLFPNRKRRQE